MTVPWALPVFLGNAPGECWNENHFRIDENGALTPQPWMQLRNVGTVEADTIVRSYAPTLTSISLSNVGDLSSLFGSIISSITKIFGGTSPLAALSGAASSAGNKNDPVHDLTLSWTNDTPIDQWVYGVITRGGARVTLQARSRGGLLLSSGYAEGDDAGALTESSMFGCGADLGKGGTLDVGTSFCVYEQRENSVSIPLAPERTGWHRLAPSATLTARAELRFISEFWENTNIDGGTSGSISEFESGDTRLDLFATPVI